MILHSSLFFGSYALWFCWAIMLYTLYVCIKSSGLSRLKNTADAIPLALIGLAQLAIPHLAHGIVEGIEFYPTLTALAELMFGLRYSLVLGALTQATNVAFGYGYWECLGIGWLAATALPATFVLGCLWLSQRYLPKNPFVYLLLNAFLVASVSAMVGQVNAAVWIMALTDYDWSYVSRYMLPFGLMLAFPEGFITGAMMTMMVLFQPHWVYTFRDSVYFTKR